MANKPQLTEAEVKYILKRERWHRATSAKATARRLGVAYRTVRRVIEGKYVPLEQWQLNLEATKEQKYRDRSAAHFRKKYKGVPVMHDNLASYRRTSFTSSEI